MRAAAAAAAAERRDRRARTGSRRRDSDGGARLGHGSLSKLVSGGGQGFHVSLSYALLFCTTFVSFARLFSFLRVFSL